MKRIWCGHYDGNVKSRRVQEKLGFVYHHTTEGDEEKLICTNEGYVTYYDTATETFRIKTTE